MNFHIEQSERIVSSGGGIAICIQKTLGQIERVETIHTGIELVHVKILLNPVIHVLCTYKSADKNLKVYTAQLLGTYKKRYHYWNSALYLETSIKISFLELIVT